MREASIHSQRTELSNYADASPVTEEKSRDVSIVIKDEDARLRELGYEQRMRRSMSKVAMVGLAFSVLSSWGEIGSSLTSGINAGGPVVLVWGWCGVSAFSLCVAVALAEICSAMPTAGGQYYWVAALLPGRFGRIFSYATAWAQIVGTVGLGAAAAANVAETVFGLVELNGQETHPWMTVILCWVSIVLAAAFNIWGRRWYNALGIVSLVWGIGGLLITVVVILAFAESFQPASFVFTDFINNTGYEGGHGVVASIGLTNLAYVMVGYDQPAHMTEEMVAAQHDAPQAIVLSVALGFITGLIYILPLMFCIVDLDAVLDADSPILPIYLQATRSMAGTAVLAVILLATQLFALTSFIGETSRSIMAFGRDGGLLYSSWFATVSPTLEVPVNGIVTTAILQGCVMAVYFGSSTAFLTILAIGTVGMYASYAAPILARSLSRQYKAGPYQWPLVISLGSNLLGLAYLLSAIGFFFVPTRYPVTADNMNYTCIAAGVTLLLALVSWFTTGSRHFRSALF